jgi:hypothetical protein
MWWEEVFVTYFKLKVRHLIGATEENNNKIRMYSCLLTHSSNTNQRPKTKLTTNDLNFGTCISSIRLFRHDSVKGRRMNI